MINEGADLFVEYQKPGYGCGKEYERRLDIRTTSTLRVCVTKFQKVSIMSIIEVSVASEQGISFLESNRIFEIIHCEIGHKKTLTSRIECGWVRKKYSHPAQTHAHTHTQ